MTFGKAALSSVDVLAVRAWLAQLQDQGASASTKRVDLLHGRVTVAEQWPR